MDLDLHFSFGLNHNIQRNAAFYDDKQLLFVAGQTCVLYNLDTKSQKRLRVADGPDITSISRCGSHIALTVKGRPPVVYLYNPASETKKMYVGVKDLDYDDFVSTAASSSRKFTAGQGNGPDWPLVIWMSTSREVMTVLRPTVGREGCVVRDVSFFGGDRDEVIVVGQNVLRLYEPQPVVSEEDSPFNECLFEKYEKKDEYFCTAWPQKENLAVSTKSGKIMFFRGIEFIRELDVIGDVKDALEGEEFEGSFPEDGSITALECGPDALVCVIGGLAVAVYKGTELREYALNKIVLMPEIKDSIGLPGQLDIPEDRITNFDYWSATNTALISTTNSQLMHVKLAGEKKIQYFASLLQRQHNEPILSTSVARRRPVVLTCSSHSAILWNLETNQQEVMVAFKDKISCAAIHPSGLYLAVSFTFYTRICTIQRDGFQDYKMLEDTKSCSRISFSYGGHRFALALGTSLEIYSFTTFERVAKLDGHADRIACMAWKNDDTRLASCDAKGVLCEWDVVNKKKMWENTCITSYTHIDVDSSGEGILAVGSNRKLKCVENAKVMFDADAANDLVRLALFSDGTTLYVGAKDGSMGRYMLPDTSHFADMPAHRGEITEMVFSQHYRVLITSGVDGIVFAWVTGEHICTEPLPMAFAARSELKKQRQRSELLKMSLKQCNIAYECDLKLSKLQHTETLREMHRQHETAVLELNEAMSDTKEAMQTALFDSKDSELLEKLMDTKRRRQLEQLEALDSSYRKTNDFKERNKEIAGEIQEQLAALEIENAQTWALEIEKEEEMLKRMRDLRDSIAAEAETTLQKRQEVEDLKKKVQEQSDEHSRENREARWNRLRAENEELEGMEEDIRRLQHLKFLVHEDVERKREVNSGKIVRDIDETAARIEVLRADLEQLEESIRRKDKALLGREYKYYESRSRVGDLRRNIENPIIRRRRVICKHNIDGLKASIEATEAETQKCERGIKKKEELLPELQESLRVVMDQCSTLKIKLAGTLNGSSEKKRLLQSEENVVAKYKALLHDSVSKDCDGDALKAKIVQLFNQSKKSQNEGEDSLLSVEFDHQIKTLQNIYRNIKSDPVKAMKDQSVAEFKLSQENMKLLNEIHEIQEEQGKLRDLIFEMEVAMGMPVSSKAKLTSAVNDLRDQIELVVAMGGKRDGAKDHEKEVKKLDEVIEEQQREMMRLKLLLAPKQAGKLLKKAVVNLRK